MTTPSAATGTDRRDGSLDALRGIAIVLVLASHARLPHADQVDTAASDRTASITTSAGSSRSARRA